MDALTTFGDRGELERSLALLERLGIGCRLISPDPGYAAVGCPALVLAPAERAAFLAGGGDELACVGWVDYRPPAKKVLGDPPPSYAEDLLGRIAIVLLAPCTADPERLRLIAHFSGDAAAALPYLNAEVSGGSYAPAMPALTYADGRRLVTLYRDRVAVAKASDIVDAWDALERVRRLACETWERRALISPRTDARRRPSAPEIYKRLPGTNCGLCGQPTCMAFAWALSRGDAEPARCQPIFEGEYAELDDRLLRIFGGLEVDEPARGAESE